MADLGCKMSKILKLTCSNLQSVFPLSLHTSKNEAIANKSLLL